MQRLPLILANPGGLEVKGMLGTEIVNRSAHAEAGENCLMKTLLIKMYT